MVGVNTSGGIHKKVIANIFTSCFAAMDEELAGDRIPAVWRQ